ncbi:MAG: hypothetical protein K0Q68_211 [Moraxellaceae bacterium]|jgi:hypothetical protein|nr:hypothetical protein [Moraxellaceae bacterium]
MENPAPKSRGRPRTAAQPMTSAERSRRHRERMKAHGATSHTVSLSPEVMQGLEQWVEVIDRQKSVEDMIEATVGFGINRMLEPGKQEMLAAFADPNNKPVGRLLALLGAMGVQSVQNEIEKELKAKP